MHHNLEQWLAYQENLSTHKIELGLERVHRVWQPSSIPARHVITVGGTNGKGSTIALLENMLRTAKLCTGAYTSPHLLRYNERIRINGVDVSDIKLIASFERVEAMRGQIPLTYFEFGTLAALALFAEADLDVALLEVGLGGRLDAVNIIDADVSVITSIDLDHMEYLGPDRDHIGREKAGIARAGRPVIIGDPNPPDGLLEALKICGARIACIGQHFTMEHKSGFWRWMHHDGTVLDLPPLTLTAPVQYTNATTAIAALHALRDAQGQPMFTSETLTDAATHGLRQVSLAARLQSLGGDPEWFVDVAHNPAAVNALADWLNTQPTRPLHAIYGAMADKDVGGVMRVLAPYVHHWHLAGLECESPRGLSAAALTMKLREVLPDAAFDSYQNVADAICGARTHAKSGEQVLAFGSFLVAAVLLDVDATHHKP